MTKSSSSFGLIEIGYSLYYRAFLALFALALTSCGDNSATDGTGVGNRQLSLVGLKSNRSDANALRDTLQRNFDLATLGAPKEQSRMAKMPYGNLAGLICSPSQLDRNRPTFQIELPPLRQDRDGFLAAIAPDGSLHEIYSGYVDDTDPEDLIIPSIALNWEDAKKNSKFMIDARTFDALAPNQTVSKRLFLDEGIYQFALMNANARGRPDMGDKPFWVIAGCVVSWQP